MNKQTIEFLEYLSKFSEGDNYTITAEFLDTMKFAIEDLKKIDKAIEYINKTVFNEKGYINFCYELENILKGGNNEK